MAYEKQNFRDGQTLRARHLENMEEGIIAAINSAKGNTKSLVNLTNRVQHLEDADYSGVDGLVVIDNVLYLTQDGQIVSDGVPLPSGGGGGSVNNAVMTMTNTSGWLAKTVAQGGACSVSVRWSSLEDEIPTGKGVLMVTVGTAVKLTKEVEQGDVPVDLTEYLAAGTNSARITISDAYGNSRSVQYTITAVAVSLSSTFNASAAYTDAIAFPYTPVGAVDKTMYFELNGSVIGTAVVASSGREQGFTIPRQIHGAHEFRCWFTAEVGGETVTSNVLHYSLICVEEGYTEPIIACAYDKATAKQYDTLLIPYIVYDPAGLTSTVKLIADGTAVSMLTVDRTEQVWSYRLMDAGIANLQLVCGAAKWEHSIEVSAVEIKVEAETSGLELHLTSYGRSNNEATPGTWSNNGIDAVFTGFNFTSDGWKQDEDGITALRVTGDARLEIPLKLFEKDFSSTGKTIELEFATRDVLNYDAVILSCMDAGRGIEITSQRAMLTSEQSSIGTQYKENEHVRLSFVVEKTGGTRFLYCYINGILSGVKQYPSGDDFSQASPVTISIGSNDCTIDLYCIRVYGNALTRYQVLDNWIADTQDATLLFERYDRNRIYDAYDQIVIENLPKDLPYLVINCPVLPSFKGDKKTCSGYYVDPINSRKSFTFEGAEIDVQGTSSQYYYVKNFKIKFKGGFTIGNTTVDDYQLNDNVIPTDTYTFKADVASSEGANNVVLAELYNELCPVKTPPQEADGRVRQTIDGHPIVIFWDSGDGNPTFAGKYNFNHDKGTEEVFGFASGDESWEILQNGTDRVGFHSADFSGDGWKTDFEARYPEDNTNTANLAAFAAWVASTDPEQATDAAIETVVYEDVEYTTDSEEYRLAKFRAELPEHASVDALVFYYVFTEIFLCIDQREKNAFPTLFRLLKLWMVLFYDADSSLGTDNKGNLAFDYYLEDIDYTDAGEPVFNGQNSVLWANLRKTYYAEIAAEYKRLRTELRGDGSGNTLISYDVANGYFEAHQNKWPEAIFNEDGYKKSIEPMVKSGDGLYLPMLQGKKEQHRKWWLYNRFRYLDSKYNTGTSMTNRITIRAHAKANVSLTSYVNMYGHVFYNAEQVEQRMTRGEEYEFEWAASGAEDAVIGINDADMLTDIGDLSALMVELVDISKATHLTSLKVGDAAAGYSNGNLKTLTLGNNVLLQSIDARNCPNYAESVDASGCTNIEELYFDGTAITGLSLPNGGAVKTLHLPGTIANLTLLNQTKITDFVLPSYSNITTLRIENASEAIDTAAILAAMPANGRVRLIGIDWEMHDADAVLALYDHLDTMRGIDEGGNTLTTAQVSGTLRVGYVTGAELAEMQRRYPYITISYDHIITNLTFANYDGTVLDVVEVVDGGDGVYSGVEPTRETTETAVYTFNGWSRTQGGAADADALKAVTTDRTVYAAYTETPIFYVSYYSEDGKTLLFKDQLIGSGHDSAFEGSNPTKANTAQYQYSFAGWSRTAGGSADATALKNITANRSVYAAFSATPIYYVKYYNWDNTLLYTDTLIGSGLTSSYEGSMPTRAETTTHQYAFSGWSLTAGGSASTSALTNVTADRNVYAAYTATPIYYVRYYSPDGGTLYYTDKLVGSGKDSTYGGETPTKASTPQFHYNFYGWALSANSSTSSDNAQKNVTADRNLYAVFASVMRTYTVYFYNGSTLLQTVYDVPYGGTATYTGSTPTYSGSGNAADFAFSGFSPSGANIAGDTSCYAQFSFSGPSYIGLIGRNITEYESDSLTTVGQYAFYQCTALTKADFAAVTSIAASAFAGCTNLSMLILRGSTVCTLASGALQNSGIAKGTGYVYVPASLVDSYKAAANWSSFANQIRAIEDYPEAYARNSWEMVNYRIQQGDYATYYAIGDTIPLDLGSEGTVNMQIAAFDTDELADGTGTAHISFVAKELLKTSHRMNPAASGNSTDGYVEGTGTIGGWPKCEMRTYLQNTIKPLIPSDVQAMIKTVTKYSDGYDTSGTKIANMESTDEVWIPSVREVIVNTDAETAGPLYTTLFSSDAARIRYDQSGSAAYWWFRSAYNPMYFRRVHSNGSYSSYYATNSYGVALGFCV